MEKVWCPDFVLCAKQNKTLLTQLTFYFHSGSFLVWDLFGEGENVSATRQICGSWHWFSCQKETITLICNFHFTGKQCEGLFAFGFHARAVWHRGQKVRKCLMNTFGTHLHAHSQYNMRILFFRLVVALSVTLGLFAIELAGFFSGVSMFNCSQGLLCILYTHTLHSTSCLWFK